MPIDFRQVAAPSFSDSNTLVALAAKQQEEAMAGIQGAWTGAMDAVQNNVQGEIQGHINQATYADLINPETRAVIDNKVRELNTQYMGMGDLNALNTYTDSRVATQQGREVSNVALEDARSLYKSGVETRDRESKNAAEIAHLNDGAYIVTDLNNKIQEAIAAGKTQQEVDILREQSARAFNQYGSTPLLQAKLADGITKMQQANQQASLGIDKTLVGIEGAKAVTDSVKAGTEGKQVNTAKILAQLDGLPAQEKAKQRSAIYAKGGLEGAVDPTTGGTLWDVVNNRLTGVMSSAADAANDPMSSDEPYADYLVKSRESLEKGGFKSQEIDSLNEVFRDYASQGLAFSDGEKKAIINGFASGTLEKNKFYDFTNKVRKGYLTAGIKEGFANDAVAANNQALSQGVRKSVEPVLQSLLDGGNSPQEIVMQLGWELDDERWQHMPSYLQQAVGWTKTDDANTDRGVPFKSNAQLNQEQDSRLSISDNLKNITSGTTPTGSGVLANKTTEDLAAVGKANNVGKVSTASNRPNNQKGNISNLVTKSGKTIPRDKVTPQMAKEANVKMVNGNLKWEDRFKGKTMETVYGEKIKINDVKDLERFIQVNYSGHVKEVQNVLANNGKSKYKYPTDLSKIDKNHPLAHPDSDNPNNFVPYDQRNYDGSRKNKKPYKYSSYDTYVKLTLNKKLGRKNK